MQQQTRTLQVAATITDDLKARLSQAKLERDQQQSSLNKLLAQPFYQKGENIADKVESMQQQCDEVESEISKLKSSIVHSVQEADSINREIEAVKEQKALLDYEIKKMQEVDAETGE